MWDRRGHSREPKKLFFLSLFLCLHVTGRGWGVSISCNLCHKVDSIQGRSPIRLARVVGGGDLGLILICKFVQDRACVGGKSMYRYRTLLLTPVFFLLVFICFLCWAFDQTCNELGRYSTTAIYNSKNWPSPARDYRLSDWLNGIRWIYIRSFPYK
jgi:hypothetical protein